jgi:peroxiredoxin
MQFRCVLLFIFCAHLVWAQVANESVNRVSIDLGWVAAVQQYLGWLITSAPAAPPMYKGKRHLQTGDVLLSIDGHDISKLGPLAVARMLEDVPFRSVPITVGRSGKTYDVQAFGEGVMTDGTTKSAPSYSPDELQKRGEAAPQFSLIDLQGRQHSLDRYRGKWLLINVWGTWCTGCWHELPALNDLSAKYSERVTVISVAVNDSPETLNTFLAQHPVSYPVLLGGSFDSAFARSYNVHVAPTNLVISPVGEVQFVGRGPMSLKTAVETIALGQRSVSAEQRRRSER